MDNSSENPIQEAMVELLNVSPRNAGYSEESGEFRLECIPVGRQRILIKAEGYEDLVLSDINIIAGKEMVLIIKLDEMVQTVEKNEKKEPKKVLMQNDKMRAINPMNIVGTRSFTVDEVRRYAGSLNDPARLVSTLASTFNTDDSQNYIISRGNAPFGIRYYVEGVSVDNPNHFQTLGNTGSPLPMINPNTLANSEFLTSAFPAEYGTSFSGIFDIHLRNGNNQKHEFTAQVGLLGLEASAEGPLKKGGASYLFNYRYSLFSLVQALNINIGTSALPQYQDLTLKFNIPTKKAGDFSFFVMGGYGTVAFYDAERDTNDIFAERERDLYLYSGSVVAGLTHKKNINKKSYIHTTLATNHVNYNSYRDSLVAGDTTKYPYYRSHEIQTIPSLSSFINSKINRQILFRTGFRASAHILDINDRYLDRNLVDYFFNGVLWDIQVFAEAQIRFNKYWVMNIGAMGEYMSMNKDTRALEPRFALVWQPNLRHRLGFGYGWHSKHVPLVTAYYQRYEPNEGLNRSNRNLGFIRSHHTELSYNWQLSKEWRFKTELFGQYLTNIPIEQVASSYSLINYGVFSIYPAVTNLTSSGVAYNYGLDATLEKFFSNGFYGHLAGTWFYSKYQASDLVWRSTGNDVRYILQLVGGKEFKIGREKINSINVDFKVQHRGGRPYIPINLSESNALGAEVLNNNLAYAVRARPYTRVDLKVGARINGRSSRISHYFYIDLINASDLVAGLMGSTYFQNDLLFKYDPVGQRVLKSTQFGLFPTFLYQVQF